MLHKDVVKKDKKGTDKKFKKRFDKDKKEISKAKDLSRELLKLKDYINNYHHSP
jgi:hypothetical protein